MINDGNHTYTYDAENRMITVGGSAQAYFYDAFGRQIQAIYGGNTYSRIFGLNGRAEVQFSGNTWMLSELYAGSVGDYLGNYSNNTTYFAHDDQVGTRRMYNGPSGSVVESCSDLPFGETSSCTGFSPGSPTGFTGQDWDPNTNQYRFPMRNYSTQQGRWIQPDPAGLAAVDMTNPQTWNRYAYVTNNPLSFTDPTGLQSQSPGACPIPSNQVQAVCKGGPNGLSMLLSFTNGSVPGWDPFDSVWGFWGNREHSYFYLIGPPLPSSGTGGVSPSGDPANTATISAYHPSVSTCLGQAAISAGEDLLGVSMLPGSDQDNWQWSSDKFGFVYTGAGEVMDSSVGFDAVEKTADFAEGTPAAQGAIRQFLRSEGVKVSMKHVAKDAATFGKWAGRAGKVYAAYSAYERYQKCRGD